jgi:hypothetical protein
MHTSISEQRYTWAWLLWCLGIGAGWSAWEFSLLYARGKYCDSIDYNKWILQTTTIRLFKKGQLVRSYQFFMSTNYNYQRRCYEYCNQTYFFLERYRENTIFFITLLMLKALVIMTSLIKATCLLLHIIERWYVCLLRMTCNFSHKGVQGLFSSRERQSHVAETFTITKSTALLVDDEGISTVLL